MSKPRCPITVSEYLLRDGTVYFIVLLLANLAQVLTQHPAFYPASVLITGFPLVLVNRFMLNLRQVQPNSISPTGSTAIPHFQCGTLYTDYGAFTSIIGNIGEPLLHASEELERNEESASPSSPLALSQEEWHA
ncbi:hypothetical protein PsYK624_067570 [Phanerochaete sordida]|uniref:Uncharacterized protein n=1 Tax=Phanerochaete sordida TaxID=48140 RepID=A0A9P3LDQ7_9APHY|nr:hypothetical protein PsYK624_067570 [Phanerochaete sordida]